MPKISPKIAIAGCGPAGLSAALALHLAGFRVELYEKLLSPVPLGSGLLLQPTGLSVMRKLGLEGTLRARGNPIDRLRGITMPSGRLALDVQYDALSAHPAGLAVHRAALFSVLHEAVCQAGIPIHAGFELKSVSPTRSGERCLISASGERTAAYGLVVDATGTHSNLVTQKRQQLQFGALWATLDWPHDGPFRRSWLEQRYRRANVMLGVLPVGRIEPTGNKKLTLFWSLPHRDYDAWRAAGLDSWKASVLQIWPETDAILGQINTAEQLTLAGYAHRTVARPFACGLAHIGDAAHCTSPQLGQGANMALLDAAALASALETYSDIDQALRHYAKLRRLHVYLYQMMSLGLTPVFQSHGATLPWLRDTLFAPLSRWQPMQKVLAATVAGVFAYPLSGLHLS